MFYLYVDRILVATAEKFSEIVNILDVEIFRECEKYGWIETLAGGLIEHDYGMLMYYDCLIEVYHGRCIS